MKKIKAVVDTNLMISSAIAKEGLTKTLKSMWINQEFQIVTSSNILKELERVLSYPRISKYITNEEIEEYISVVMDNAIFTKGKYQLDKIKDDPSDNKFLACAVEGKAGYIVSRDKHLRKLKDFQGIKIIGVKEFLEILKQQK